jgi:hypothetical protein
MPKLGHPLREIPVFEPSILERLRDKLSVTTAEEFVGLWRSVPEALSSVLGPRTAELADAATRTLSPQDIENLSKAEESSYPFRTGHWPPPAGKTNFK